MLARLALDDLPWSTLPLDDEATTSALEDVCELLALAKTRHQEVVVHASIYEIPRLGAQTLNGLLSDGRITRDLCIEMWRRLDKVRNLEDTEVTCLEVQLAGSRYLAPTVAWAASKTAGGHTVGCLSPRCSQRAGALQIELCDCDGVSSSDLLDVFFVGASSGVRELYRDAIVRENACLDTFIDLASDAYPELEFVDGALRGCRDLSRPFRDRRADVMRHLAVLNDHGPAIFATKMHAEIQAGFRAHGIDISPETHETMRDHRCRSERERSHQGKPLAFEWHTKIEPHQDRIYVCPPNQDSPGRLIVGIIHRHLGLPGD